MNNSSWTQLDELKAEMQEEIQKLKRLSHLEVVNYPRELLEKSLKVIEQLEEKLDFLS